MTAAKGKTRARAAERASAVPQIAADNILALIHILSSVIGVAFYRELEAHHGLTVPQWRILVTLANHAGVTAVEIVERWALQPMMVSRAISQLEAAGLVVRRTPATDRRSQKIYLTVKGRKTYQRVVPHANARYEAITGGLSQRELHDLGRALVAMIARTRALIEDAACSPRRNLITFDIKKPERNAGPGRRTGNQGERGNGERRIRDA